MRNSNLPRYLDDLRSGCIGYVAALTKAGNRFDKPMGLRLKSPGLQNIQQLIKVGLLPGARVVEGPDTAHFLPGGRR